MRLTFKLTLGTLIAVALLLAINLGFRVQREVDTLQQETMRDHLMFSRALRVDIIDEWHDGGQPGAFQLIQRINAERAGIDITAWQVDQLPDDIAFTLNEGREVQRVEAKGDGEVLVTWSPIAPRGRLLASLRLEESLAPVNAYVKSTLTRVAFSTALGLIVVGVVAFFSGFYAVGRPVQALVEKARRVGRGELEGDVKVARPLGDDELSVLAGELNVMSTRLKEAREALEAEHEARMGAVEQLRHAERLSTVGTLAAGIAHELGTPLNVVAGRAQLIAAGANDATRQAQIINEQTQRVIRIVRQLLDFARAEAPYKDVVELKALATECVELLAPMAAERRVQLRVEGEEHSANVDESQLLQALTNLVMNAVQASAEGGDVVVRVRSFSSGPPGQVAVEVEDAGPGVPAEVRDRVFSPFFTTKPPGEGTGLGLAVAWGIVRENGGAIELDNSPERARDPEKKGALFRILLPETHAT